MAIPIIFMLLSPSGEFVFGRQKGVWLLYLSGEHSCHLVVTFTVPALNPWKSLLPKGHFTGGGLILPLWLESVWSDGQNLLSSLLQPPILIPSHLARKEIWLTWSHPDIWRQKGDLRNHPVPNLLKLLKMLGILNNLWLISDIVWPEFLNF